MINVQQLQFEHVLMLHSMDDFAGLRQPCCKQLKHEPSGVAVRSFQSVCSEKMCLVIPGI